MKSLFISENFTYDGSQLRSLFAYLNCKVLGNSVVSWVGPCSIPFDHMVDGEDLLEGATIAGHKMLHFIVEVFDRDLFAAVGVQRLLASIVKDYLQEKCLGAPNGIAFVRSGDDIYIDQGKLSISIATRSPVSVLVHFAINVTNEGTPVQTASLKDLGLDAHQVAQDVMTLLVNEFNSMVEATQKVRPVQ